MQDKLIIVMPSEMATELSKSANFKIYIRPYDSGSGFELIHELADIVTIAAGTISIIEAAGRLAPAIRSALNGRQSATVLVRARQDDVPVMITSEMSDSDIVDALVTNVE